MERLLEPTDELGVELLDEDEEASEPNEVDEAPQEPKRRWGSCPKGEGNHEVIPNPKKRGPYDDEYVCKHCGKSKWTPSEIEELITNPLLREDSNREMCQQCLEDDPGGLPYGEETGHVEWQPQFKDGEPILDSEGHQLYVAFPELRCERGHRWFKGEGPRRDLRGRNPILFETHLYNRRRRELMAKEGVVDPAYTMDRWGKRPIQGLYVRSHPQGRKTNTPEQRKEHGAGFTSSLRGLKSLPETQIGTVNQISTWYSISDDQTLLCLQQIQGYRGVLSQSQG